MSRPCADVRGWVGGRAGERAETMGGGASGRGGGSQDAPRESVRGALFGVLASKPKLGNRLAKTGVWGTVNRTPVPIVFVFFCGCVPPPVLGLGVTSCLCLLLRPISLTSYQEFPAVWRVEVSY